MKVKQFISILTNIGYCGILLILENGGQEGDMRSFGVNIRGRVKNFPLPKNQPLVPVFEAVVNSFHAAEERRRAQPDFLYPEIQIELIRNGQMNEFHELCQLYVCQKSVKI